MSSPVSATLPRVSNQYGSASGLSSSEVLPAASAKPVLRPLALGDVPIVNRQTLLGRIGMHLVPPLAQRRASFELAGLLLAHGVVVLVVEYGAHEFGIHLPYVLS